MDLTKSILIASNNKSQSLMKSLILTVEDFSNKTSLIVDWDREDGEQWGRLLEKQRVVVLFHSQLPLIFVDDNYYIRILNFLKKSNLINETVVNSVTSWEDQNYSIEIDQISNIINWNSNIETDKLFSINDFWYATV